MHCARGRVHFVRLQKLCWRFDAQLFVDLGEYTDICLVAVVVWLVSEFIREQHESERIGRIKLTKLRQRSTATP